MRPYICSAHTNPVPNQPCCALAAGRQDFWSAPRHEMIGFCKKLSLEARPGEMEQTIVVRDDYLSDRSDATFMISKR